MILCDFIWAKMIKFSFPKICFLASAGRPDWSTELEVGRPSRSADVHRMCTPVWLEGQSTDPVDRRELLLSGKPRSTGRELCSLSSATVDRPVDRSLNGQNSDRWPVDRAIDRQANLAPTASFSSSINWGIWGLFSTRFWSGFWDSFSNSFQSFSHLFREQIFPIKRGVYQECFKSDFLEFSSTISILIFLTNTWAIHWYIHPIGVFLWDCF